MHHTDQKMQSSENCWD